MSVTPDHHLRTCTVVGGEQDKRVFKSAHRFELGKNPADLLVHPVDHRGVNRHFFSLKLPLRFGEVSPGNGPVHLVGAEL